MIPTFRILYLGPFDAPYRTESLLAAALTEHGHHVLRAPLSNRIWPRLPRLMTNRDILFWTHRADFCKQTSQKAQLEVLAYAKDNGVLTVSYHLDRFWDLARESDIHDTAMFRTDLVLTADGGNDDRFADAGVNHRWISPGVGLSDCLTPGRRRPVFDVDVAFVGSHDRYHPEWPWRLRLIQLLRDHYGDRFQAFPATGQQIRGRDLTDLYASAKVVVGDSCFASEPRGDYYFSDRVMETVGRGGFLLHPTVKGLDKLLSPDKHLAYFTAGDEKGLIERINHYLAAPDERAELVHNGRAEVRDNHTWRNRAYDMMCGMVEQRLEMLGWTAPARPGTYDAVVVRETWLDDVYHARGNIHEGDVVVDLGANIGAFSIWAAKQGARVVAVEPLPENVEALRNNAYAMGVEHLITVRNVAVAEDERTIAMSWFADDHSQSTYRTDDGHLHFPALPLSDLLPDGPVAFLKVDIEASEVPALRNADLSRVQRIGIETHNTPNGTTHEAIKQICRDAGFTVTDSGGHSEGLCWGVR